MKKVLLLSMPFGALERQALGLSLFKARLSSEGIRCEIRYFTFVFADLIGVEEYCWLSTDIPHTAFAGEWIFTPCLYGPTPRVQAGFVREVLKGLWSLDDRSVGRILHAQAMAPHFIEYCLQAVRWNDYAIIGFTSTFEQNISSLALARQLKRKYPSLAIVFGGANWEGEMGLELHRCFPFVDFAFSGEADESFPKFVRLILSGHLKSKTSAAIPGLIRRSGGSSLLTKPPEPVRDLDRLPIPDYSDYFRDFDRGSAGSFVVPNLLFEGSRGCWWGEKRHCMFCGLNGAMLKSRTKSPARAYREIRYLAQRWKSGFVQAVDNVVPMRFFRELFPKLAQADSPERMFYEIRANLSREQIKALHDARVLNVQPGIESFSDHILALMRKGTTVLHNVQMLKWSKEYGVQADYNLLYGFPGETDEDYRRTFEILQAIRFLGPPTACGPIRLDRFSPYFQEAEKHGFAGVKPMLPYKYLYPFGDTAVSRIAYYFDYDLPSTARTRNRWLELFRWVEDWKKSSESGTLQAFERLDGSLALLDTRTYAHRSCAVLRGLDKEVYNYCDSVRSLDSILNHLRQTFPLVQLGAGAVQSFLEALVAHGYMLKDDSNYLSLALRSEAVGRASM